MYLKPKKKNGITDQMQKERWDQCSLLEWKSNKFTFLKKCESVIYKIKKKQENKEQDLKIVKDWLNKENFFLFLYMSMMVWYSRL